MSLEYAIECHCGIRKSSGEPAMRMLARTARLVSRVVSETIEGERTPSAESFEFTTRHASEVERIEQISRFCRANCPAGFDSRLSTGEGPEVPAEPEPIHCLGRIRYPIEARFEHFLADRVQLLYDTSDGGRLPGLLQLLLEADSPFDGEVTKELRRVTTPEGLRFYERRLPIPLVRRASRLTTDNIFDLMAGFSSTDEGASGYQRELPAFALADFSDLFEAILFRDLGAAEVQRMSDSGGTYLQYLRLGRAMGHAARLGVRLLLD